MLSQSNSFTAQKLTAGELTLLISPDEKNLTSINNIPSAHARGSLFERWEALQNVLENQSDVKIHKVNGEIPTPAKLISSCEELPLLSFVEIPDNASLYVKIFIEELVGNVKVKTNLKFQLPEALFDTDKFDMSVDIPSHSVDISSIAFTQDGSRRLALVDDSDAFRGLKLSGVYKRGDFHITFSWYPGTDKILRWRHESWAKSLYQIQLLPSDISGILQGTGQLVIGIGMTLNRLIGIMPSKIPKYSRKDVNIECAKAYFSWLEAKEFKVKGIETHYKKNKVGRYAAIFQHSSRGTLDFRTWIPFIKHRLLRILARTRDVAATEVGSKRMALIRDTSTNDFLDVWHNTYLEAIKEQRKSIDCLSTSPDLTHTVLREQQAMLLIADYNDAKQLKCKEKEAQEIKLWTEAHPIKATYHKYVEKQLEKIRKMINTESEAKKMDDIKEVVSEGGLNEYALLLETQRDFKQSEDYLNMKKKMMSTKKAAKIAIPFMKLPLFWKVQDFHMASGPSYFAEVHREINIPTSIPLWRVIVFIARYFSQIWNGNFWLFHEAMIGIRRWNVLQKDFSVRLAHVDSNGRFCTRICRTIRGRLTALSRWRDEVIQRARESEHIIKLRNGLYLDTCWANFWTSVGVVNASIAIIVITVVESLSRFGLFGIGLITSPVWSLIIGVARSLFNAFVYDCEFPYEEDSEARAPLVRSYFGVTKMLRSTACAIFHPVKALGVGIFGEGHYYFNRMWHILMTALLKRAEIPTKATGYFWNTSGPGMKTPFVLVDSSTALLLLLVLLSREELKIARHEVKMELKEPRKKMEQKIATDSAQTMHLNSIRVVSHALQDLEQKNMQSLSEYQRLLNTEHSFEQLLQCVEANQKIRMVQKELESFMLQAVPLVKKFYLERYFPRVTLGEVVEFWETRNLLAGDWFGLTKLLVSTIFTKEIVVPFEAASDDLVVEANQMSGLETIVKQALEEQGLVTGTCTHIDVGNPVQSEDLPNFPRYDEIPLIFEPQLKGDTK